MLLWHFYALNRVMSYVRWNRRAHSLGDIVLWQFHLFHFDLRKFNRVWLGCCWLLIVGTTTTGILKRFFKFSHLFSSHSSPSINGLCCETFRWWPRMISEEHKCATGSNRRASIFRTNKRESILHKTKAFLLFFHARKCPQKKTVHSCGKECGQRQVNTTEIFQHKYTSISLMGRLFCRWSNGYFSGTQWERLYRVDIAKAYQSKRS